MFDTLILCFPLCKKKKKKKALSFLMDIILSSRAI